MDKIIKDETYFIFPPGGKYNKIICLKVNRPGQFFHRDKDIGNRIYEQVIGINKTDDWTKEMDAFIKMEHITYTIITIEDLKQILKEEEFDVINRL